MKRIRILLLLTLCVSFLTACGGRTSGAWRSGMELSQVYSAEEIHGAMDAVEEYFRVEFAGCELMNLRYTESAEILGEQAGWADKHGADEAIVLQSDFSTSRWVRVDGLQPDDCYIDWKWVLTREVGGEWQLRLGEKNERHNP